jgi:hypothetical protein
VAVQNLVLGVGLDGDFGARDDVRGHADGAEGPFAHLAVHRGGREKEGVGEREGGNCGEEGGNHEA